MFINPVQMITY